MTIRPITCGKRNALNFIAAVPSTWDNTVALNGKIAEYIAVARQKGSDWYVGSLTNWDSRTLELDLSFLGEGAYAAEVFRDGINADRAARDYVKELMDIPSAKKITISVAPGGGYALRIFRK